MHRVLVFAVVATFLSAVGCSTPDVRPSSATVDELMLKSGLWIQLAQVEPTMQLGISQAHAESSRLAEGELENLSKAVGTAYAADTLRAAVRDRFRLTLSAQDAANVLRWLSSDLGQRITALEEAGSGPGEVLERQASGPRLLANLSAPRRERVERLAKATLAAEAAATILIDSMVGIARGVALSTPGTTTESVDDLKSKFESQEAQYIEALRPQILADFAAMYQPLSDQELDRYVAFCESPSGHRYAQAALDAIDKALSEAAVRLGQHLLKKPTNLSPQVLAPRTLAAG